MKGDFSRSTFHREKHYSKVNYQQGRVTVDADFNEQIDIIHHYKRTALKDIIGQSGFPKGLSSGFMISQNQNSQIHNIGAGRYYVDGILIENESDVAADKQPDLPSFKNGKNLAIPDHNPEGYYLIYLDVWERHIAYLDDPVIKESALGGPDTATRSQIVWQVKSHPIETPDGAAAGAGEIVKCEPPPKFWDSLDSPGGSLIARTKPGLATDDPCIIKPASGYRGLENQLYRIEIHNSGKPGENSSSFKWSRDNGTVCTKALNITDETIAVADIGKDKLLGFNNQQWVEVRDDRHVLLNLPGTITKINVINENEFAIVDGSVKGESLTNSNYPQQFNPQIRRWDSVGGALPIKIPSSNEGFIPIENGIEIKFLPDAYYRTGDYHYIPARTFIGEIEWPRVNGVPQSKPPDGIKHHFARLAILQFNSQNQIVSIQDCRKEFPPLTELGPSLPTPPTPASPKGVSTWAHGNIVWADDPTRLEISEKRFDGTIFKQNNKDANNTFHFPLSTSFSTDDNSKLYLTNVHLLFTAKEGVSIRKIQLVDGKKEVPSNINIESVLPTDNTSSNLIPNKNSWAIHPSSQILFGLGISVKVRFRGTNREIIFHSVGADFSRT